MDLVEINSRKTIEDNKSFNEELQYNFYEDSIFCMINKNSEDSKGDFQFSILKEKIHLILIRFVIKLH